MQRVLSQIGTKGTGPINVSGLRSSSSALFLARIAEKKQCPIMCVVPTEAQLSVIEQDVRTFTALPVLTFPGYEIPPYTLLSPDGSTTASRLSALYRLTAEKSPSILLVSSEALLRKVLPINLLERLAELVIRGEETEQQQLAASLIKSGYEQVSLVQNSGEFTIRGGVVDIYPPLFAMDGQDPLDAPIRLDFFGDTVESIRYFDPISQRSIKELDEAIFLPVSDILFAQETDDFFDNALLRFTTAGKEYGWNRYEQDALREKIENLFRFPGIEFFLPLFYKKLSSVTDVLAEETIVVVLDPLESSRTTQLTWERISQNYQDVSTANHPCLEPQSLFLTEQDLATSLEQFTTIFLHDFSGSDQESDSIPYRTGNHSLLKQQLELSRKKEGLIAPLARQFTEWQELKETIVLTCRSDRHAAHLAEMLSHYNFETTSVPGPLRLESLDPNRINLLTSTLSAGFDLLDEGLHILSENELFGEKRIGPKRKIKHPSQGDPVRFEELRPNDIVVHSGHGIGIFQGIINMELNGVANDFLQIIYDGDDKLYVPIDRLNTISKYQGVSDKAPKLCKLGGVVWARTKKKVTEAVWKVAQELLDIYAKRELATGHAFSAPDSLYHELEESFPFDETSGQLRAINDCIADLTAKQTMDRLVCGDVGYGKTEVAVRAAFKVIADGYQVAMLVPTTILAEQHAQSFKERYQGFPLQVESLNRFRSTKEQKQVISDLAAGRVDIVIGTHRLLSKDVSFKKLGLLIIDEEHRFGVAHKEKLKKLKSDVDILTLTATPIPRTLQLSLLGIRDLSTISSPPSRRRSVKTFVAKHDDLVIKEAIVKELQRKGQVFLVHNRVQSIHEVARTAQKLVPDARIAVAHGQMGGKQLEDIMISFINKEIDVLVCTTIIESGLDIPNANTIIITRADRFGLAEIYQLRGRVGRSSQQAYAYLLVPSLDGLSKDARQRLRALMDYNELGGGFKLAMSDLQIRGGGSILGKNQSGNITAVGYDLYLELLQKTVEDLKRRGKDDGPDEDFDFEPEVSFTLPAYIPDYYIADSDQRYIAYRKITSIRDDMELEDLQDELRDRYGKIPDETNNLLRIITLKFSLRKLRISKLEQGPASLVFTFLDSTPVGPEKILDLVDKSKNKNRFTPDGKLIVSIPSDNADTLFNESRKVLQALV